MMQANVLWFLAASAILCFLGALIGAALYKAFDLIVLGDRVIFVSLTGLAVSIVLIVVVGLRTAATLG